MTPSNQRTLLRVWAVAQRDSRRIGLWRSGIGRDVWPLDVQRASASRSVSATAYAASVMRADCLKNGECGAEGQQEDWPVEERQRKGCVAAGRPESLSSPLCVCCRICCLCHQR